MAISPAWQPAVVGAQGTAGHVNQFLVGHESTVSYGGTLQGSSAPGSGVYSSTQTQWLSQQFVTAAAQTTVGYVRLQISDVGGSPTLALIPSLTVELYADSLGLPTGPVLASATVTGQYLYSQPWWATIPLAASGLTAGTPYQIVTSMAGAAGHYYVWQHSTTAGGSGTSPDGTTWTANSFGLMYQIFDQNGGASTMPLILDEDNGLRVTSFTYNASNQLASISTYTTSSAGTVAYAASLTYSNGLITGVG
ncbi:MAG: hypothetical protein HOW97_09655 [Catenulispora sp.]|nr:hypothetical protein [Catenulispora sp.]